MNYYKLYNNFILSIYKEMSKYFISHCVKPIYMLNTKEQATQCGTWDGVFSGLTVVVIAFVLAAHFFIKEYSKSKEKKYVFFIGAAIISVVLFTGSVITSRFGSETVWKGYADSMDELLAQGLTRLQAISVLQTYEKSSPLQSGLIGGGSLQIAARVFSSKKDGEEQPQEPVVPQEIKEPQQPQSQNKEYGDKNLFSSINL